MNIAICAPFLEADLLEEKIRAAVPGEQLFVDEYYSADALLALPSLSGYQSVWVALPGARGMEAVKALRARSREVPIVWLSEDAQFVWKGVDFLTTFLTGDSTEDELRAAVNGCLRENRKTGRAQPW